MIDKKRANKEKLGKKTRTQQNEGGGVKSRGGVQEKQTSKKKNLPEGRGGEKK